MVCRRIGERIVAYVLSLMRSSGSSFREAEAIICSASRDLFAACNSTAMPRCRGPLEIYRLSGAAIAGSITSWKRRVMSAARAV